jgi:DNA-directed RNA polymerase specialized sigma24 family protein
MRTVGTQTLQRAQRVEVQDDRKRIQEALKRAELLPEHDRLLAELVMRNASLRTIGGIFKISPGSISRRVRDLSRRLYDPMVVALLHKKCPLPADLRQMGVERLLLKMNYKDIARKHQLHPTEVRKRLGFLKGWHEGVDAGRQLWQRVF